MLAGIILVGLLILFLFIFGKMLEFALPIFGWVIGIIIVLFLAIMGLGGRLSTYTPPVTSYEAPVDVQVDAQEKAVNHFEGKGF
jgi:hypothetical protein